MENNRPGVMERLGLGYDALAALQPGLVMVRISGHDQTPTPNARLQRHLRDRRGAP